MIKTTKGQSFTEYTILVFVIAIALIPVIRRLSSNLKTKLQNTAHEIAEMR